MFFAQIFRLYAMFVAIPLLQFHRIQGLILLFNSCFGCVFGISFSCRGTLQLVAQLHAWGVK